MTDYREVLRELEEREAEIQDELKDIQAAKPAIQRMAKAMKTALPIRVAVAQQEPPVGLYAGLGTKEAITALLGNAEVAMSVSEISSALLAGGIKTLSQDFSAVVKSTLAQLKTENRVERKEDGWVIVKVISSVPTEPALPAWR